MNEKYALLFRKGNGTIVNSFTQWGIVCAKVPFDVGGKTKEPAKREWPDEHGEDAYLPTKLMMQAYDAEFEMAYKGKELASNPFDLSLAESQIKAFKKWLTGNDNVNGSGSELKIYSPYSTIGRQKCYLLEIDDEEPHLQTVQDAGNVYNENVVTFKVTFRVTDPMTDIELTETSSSSS